MAPNPSANRDASPIDVAPAADAVGAGLCDGSSQMVFTFVREGGGQAGPTLMIENGHVFFHVRGDCRYWVSPGNRIGIRGDLADVKTGVLTTDDVAALESLLAAGRFDEHAGRDYWGSVVDTGPDTIWRRGQRLSCNAFCFWKTDQPELHRLFSSLLEQIFVWADAGTSVTGDVRIVVVAQGTGTSDATLWPLADPMANFVEPNPYSVGPGHGHLVRQPDAEVLRSLRRRVVSAREPYIAVRATVDGPAHVLHVRDTTPLEDARGLIPRHW
ncbi:MAG TPA: hypothetical protein VGF45_17510 [Polyangia bacterium]